MRIAVPRALIVTLAIVFSSYHLVLAALSLQVPISPIPAIIAMVLYAAITTIALWPSSSPRMPVWMAASTFAVSIVMALLVTSQLPEGADGTYAAWHTAAIGTLMVIVSIRRRQTWAWLGIILLAVETVFWQGIGGLVDYGVLGSMIWVGVSHALANSLSTAERDTRQYAIAEQEATAWRAAQDAHVFERQFRLGQTSRMSLPMLRQIVATAGDLTAVQRQECLYLEGAIRDEIRGRKLLNDRVRDEVMAARRRGATVNLLDEGGIDDLDDANLERVLNALADAIASTTADRIIARTVPHGSEIAVTVVGLSIANDGEHTALGHESEDGEDEIDLWLELPRSLTASRSFSANDDFEDDDDRRRQR